ncbi:glycosyltransferase family 87 protein [uncultured Thiodictyon sp.]|uniref:glycosyltransferase family 87 protein n=1 Tax=uncultured Thiodictyon sp. TaxID=1846217 RepID=UPI0025D43EF8|nr:glycosyltransferase family 87 protein [uncultured Thiodictyon sp.]
MPYYEITEARLRRITLALGVGLLLGVFFYLGAGKRENSSFFQGDFPAFYAAAEIVWTGRGADLYDFGLQRALENRHWPDLGGGYYVYPYPPFFALLLSPFASLSPLVAKGLASTCLFTALLVALALARKSSAFVHRHFLFSLVYLLTFVPLQIAIVGVQNTALSILCFALLHWASQNGRPLLTGLCASLLLYKPQFGAIVFLYLLGRGRRSELIGWSFGALVMYFLGTLVLGVSWPLIWVRAAFRFGDINFTINDYNMISIAGVMYWVFDAVFGVGAPGLPWAYLLSVTLLAFSVWYVRRDEHRFVLVPHLALLFSPQTLFYDVAIAIYCLMRDLRPSDPSDFKRLAAIWIYGVIAFLLRDLVSFPLFSLLLLAILWLHFRRMNELIPVRGFLASPPQSP